MMSICKSTHGNEELKLLDMDGVVCFESMDFTDCPIKDCLEYIGKTNDTVEFIRYACPTIKIEGDVVNVK